MFKISREQAEQIALFDWIRLDQRLSDAAMSFPNEGKRTPWYGRLLKRMGLRKGASDIFIAIPIPGHHGLFIEMKAKDKNGKWGRPTKEQLEFGQKMMRNGYHFEVAKGADDAINIIKKYLSGGYSRTDPEGAFFVEHDFWEM